MNNTFADYWAAKVRGNPKLADDNTIIRMTTEQLRSNLAKAWADGHKNGEVRMPPSIDPIRDLFGRLET